MQHKTSIIRWWIMICLQLLAVSIAVFFGFHEILWKQDQTKLSFAIVAVWSITSAFVGYWHWITDMQRVRDCAKIGWFLAETCLALGMLGTVAGFLLMLSTSFSAINVQDTSTLQTALTNMALGMSTALYTTLVGLVCSIFIKMQLVNLENMVDQNGQP